MTPRLLLFLVGCSAPVGEESVATRGYAELELPAPEAGDDSGRLDMDGDGWVDGDCAETDPAINPGAPELCNGVDDDCDGTIDTEAVDARDWFADADGDT